MRVCDNGGWTDTWFARYGRVFSIAVNPYAEVQMQVYPREAGEPQIAIFAENYGERYTLSKPEGIYAKHPLLEAAFDYMDVPDDLSIDIGIFSEAPSGCSTGTSAAAEGPYVLVVGGLTQRKGGSATLDVAEELGRRGSPLSFVVAGRSDDDLASRAGAIANVVELGVVDDEVLPPLMRGAVALSFLSIYEGFGIPAVEAMAAGTPPVVSHHASLPEVVGDAGLIVDPSDTSAAADLLDRLYEDTVFRDGYAAAGRVRAEMFRWDRCVDLLAAAFRDAHAGLSPGGSSIVPRS